ncbi:hypothetical protein [Pedobacter sp. MW01-1-1]|uniref:hypothetical protein n=1 Tax=Pedobacter sp. MW01-1-1 TaxID=3383027 RepID=UPI003FEDD8EB
MKAKLILLIISVSLTFSAKAQNDSSTYELQRTKVNQLLRERSNRFGKYDESLNQKTGVFGWQTKKDIKNSNEILRQIVLTDNLIFKELKTLMEFKDLQNQQKVIQSDQASERINGYQMTIKKLQEQNASLKLHAEKKGTNIPAFLNVFLLLVIAIGCFYYIFKLKRNEKISVQNLGKT